MMHTAQQLAVVQARGFRATRLLYKGDDSAMYILLPDEGQSLQSVIASLDASSLAGLRERLRSSEPTEVELGLPKLDTTFGAAELRDPLVQLGMARAFDSGRAQFDAMADPSQARGPLYIDSVLHKTRLKIDEKGTEAAAATMVGMAGCMPNPNRFICDRPYLVAIVDEPSGALLFLGEIEDPRSR